MSKVEKASILHYPDPVLREVAEDVSEIDDDIKRAIRRMRRLMYQHDGYAVAAPQVGLQQRFIIMNTNPWASEEREANERVLINPSIVESSNETVKETEGCLSLPGYFVNIERPKQIKVKYLDLDGQEQELDADEIEARIIQHEIDHLDGKLIIDYANEVELAVQKSILNGLEQRYDYNQQVTKLAPKHKKLRFGKGVPKAKPKKKQRKIKKH